MKDYKGPILRKKFSKFYMQIKGKSPICLTEINTFLKYSKQIISQKGGDY